MRGDFDISPITTNPKKSDWDRIKKMESDWAFSRTANGPNSPKKGYHVTADGYAIQEKDVKYTEFYWIKNPYGSKTVEVTKRMKTKLEIGYSSKPEHGFNDHFAIVEAKDLYIEKPNKNTSKKSERILLIGFIALHDGDFIAEAISTAYKYSLLLKGYQEMGETWSGGCPMIYLAGLESNMKKFLHWYHIECNEGFETDGILEMENDLASAKELNDVYDIPFYQIETKKFKSQR